MYVSDFHGVLNSHVQVPGRLLYFHPRWIKSVCPRWVLDLIKVTKYHLCLTPSFLGARETPLSGQYAQVLVTEVESLLLGPVLWVQGSSLWANNLFHSVLKGVSTSHGIPQVSGCHAIPISWQQFGSGLVSRTVVPVFTTSSPPVVGSGLLYKYQEVAFGSYPGLSVWVQGFRPISILFHLPLATAEAMSLLIGQVRVSVYLKARYWLRILGVVFSMGPMLHKAG